MKLMLVLFNEQGGDSDRRVCQLGICKDHGLWMGMGWSHLVVQYHYLHSSRHSQVYHPLLSHWKGLG